ncbi:predicted protein [Histoplasma capsulatum var. duboisii H88]|uniref:Predicted protein n=1 Tax=Ajellomyces capsulatus (strain H88) TaxID=544711 RepID=F0UQ20_AJEC8|nr:predicted protein [Histoplasma capsulatum var. duboisii H88]
MLMLMMMALIRGQNQGGESSSSSSGATTHGQGKAAHKAPKGMKIKLACAEDEKDEGGPSERTSTPPTGFKELFWGWSMFGRGACLVLRVFVILSRSCRSTALIIIRININISIHAHAGAPDGVQLGALVARSLWKNWTCTVHGAFSQPDGIDALSIQGTIQSDSTSTANQVANSISPKQRSPRRWNGGTAEGSRPPPTNISQDELLPG